MDPFSAMYEFNNRRDKAHLTWGGNGECKLWITNQPEKKKASSCYLDLAATVALPYDVMCLGNRGGKLGCDENTDNFVKQLYSL